MAIERRRGRPTGDVTRLTLFGLLASKPMHGYELRQQMQQFDMKAWVDIQPGSIYAALPRMAAEGLLEVVEVTQDGNRPAKTVYRITRAGRAELARLLGDAWAKPASMAQPVDVALFFMWHLPPAEIATHLEDRLATLDDSLEHIERNRSFAFGAIEAARGQAPTQYFEMMLDLFDHARQIVTTERSWSARTLERVRAGVFSFEPIADGTAPVPSEVGNAEGT
jgi:DNA-binding PadR family transcriptional regulator